MHLVGCKAETNRAFPRNLSRERSSGRNGRLSTVRNLPGGRPISPQTLSPRRLTRQAVRPPPRKTGRRTAPSVGHPCLAHRCLVCPCVVRCAGRCVSALYTLTRTYAGVFRTAARTHDSEGNTEGSPCRGWRTSSIPKRLRHFARATAILLAYLLNRKNASYGLIRGDGRAGPRFRDLLPELFSPSRRTFDPFSAAHE